MTIPTLPVSELEVPSSTSDIQSSPPLLANRLVPLCDGRPGLRAGLHIDIREPDSAINSPPSTIHSPTLDFISSDETLDRYDEILSASGWRLDNYRRNPVFQNAHQYGDIIFTLGKALFTEVRMIGGRAALFQRVEFAVGVNPMAKIAYGLYRGNFLNAVSVGFIPIRWEDGGTNAAVRRKYLEQELLEVSAVGIPANPEALQLGLKAGAIEKADLQDLLELLRSFTRSSRRKEAPFNKSEIRNPKSEIDRSLLASAATEPISCLHPAAPNTPACASGVRSNEAQWLQLVRDLKQLLRRA
jgi:hypothetical protein